MWVVFSHKEISWVFECSAILDCILDIVNVLRLWVLFESYLCFSRQLVCLGSGYKFWPAFCGSWFQYQSHFQSVVLFDFVLQKLLSGQCGTWAVIHQSWVLKNVVCSWGPDWCTCSSGVAKDLWRPYGVTLLGPSLSTVFLVPSSLPGTPLSSSNQPWTHLLSSVAYSLQLLWCTWGWVVGGWKGRKRNRSLLHLH